MRTKPYTERGLRRLRCVVCNQPARYQWKVCASPFFYQVCEECDLELNRETLGILTSRQEAIELAGAYWESNNNKETR